MKYFSAIIHKDRDSAYGLWFPDLPGCFAAADDWNDVPKAASEALDLWFEDRPNATPSSIEIIRTRDDVATALAEGAAMIVVRYISPDAALRRVNVSIENGLLRAIDETARARGMTRSSFLASAARRELVGYDGA